MKSGLVVFMALSCATYFQGPLQAQPGPRGGEQDAVKNGWLFSLEDGKAQAKKNGKPLMVVLRCVP